MTNPKGLDAIQRNYHESIPREDIPFLEDIRRAANAVRILRRLGRPTSSAQYAFERASSAYHLYLEQQEHDYMNPGLF